MHAFYGNNIPDDAWLPYGRCWTDIIFLRIESLYFDLRDKEIVASIGTWLLTTDRAVPSNLWVGVTVENADVKHRIDYLREVPTPKRFLSCEPLIGNLGELNLSGINWIIVGGESGSSARPMVEEWVLNIKEQADAAGVPFFFKQWGTWGADGIKRNKKKNGKLLQGKIVQNMPKDNVTE